MEHLAEDTAVPTPPTADVDEVSPDDAPEPDAVEPVVEVPDAPDAAVPDAAPAPVVPPVAPVAPVAQSETDGAAPEVGRAEGALDARPPLTGGSTVETPESPETPESHQVPVTDDTVSVVADGGDTWTAAEVPWDVADLPGDAGEPATVTDTSAPGASPTESRTQGASTATDVGLGAGTEPPAPSPIATSPLSGPDRPHGRHEATGGSPATP